MNNLPTHIQRSYYAPGPAQKRRDEFDRNQEEMEHTEKTERMVIRGPGEIGGPGAEFVARFAECPDDLMEAIIYRYNQHNYLLKKIKQMRESLDLWIAGKGVWAQIILGIKEYISNR